MAVKKPVVRPVREPGELGAEMARLYTREKMSLRQIGRQVGLTHAMVRRYLLALDVRLRDDEEGRILELRLRPASTRCPWPGCVGSTMTTATGYRLGACTRHVKLALGLMTS